MLNDEFRREAEEVRKTLSQEAVAKVTSTLRELEKIEYQPRITQAPELSREASERLEILKEEVRKLKNNGEALRKQEVGAGFNWIAAVEELEPRRAEFCRWVSQWPTSQRSLERQPRKKEPKSTTRKTRTIENS